MNFKQKYTIIEKYLTPGSKKRSGNVISPTVKFVVAHDTGNPNSTAAGNVKYYKNNEKTDYPSAHIFVDDKEIIECIPALLSDKPEKAWHVMYDKPKDNELFGFDANDAALGVEYCYGDKINADEAYRRYVWVIAYICYKFNLNPRTSIAGHCILDPGRKTDPVTGLKHSGRTYDKLLRDIVTEYEDCVKDPDQEKVDSSKEQVNENISQPQLAVPFPLMRDLKKGSSGSDVKLLQQILNTDPDTRVSSTGPGSPGNESETFGDLTEKAVQRFQIKYSIASSNNPDFGIVGPKTRVKLSQIYQKKS